MLGVRPSSTYIYLFPYFLNNDTIYSMSRSMKISEDRYRELLVLCAHDTHHDFFEPKETFKNLLGPRRMSMGGGGKSDEPTTPRRSVARTATMRVRQPTGLGEQHRRRSGELDIVASNARGLGQH